MNNYKSGFENLIGTYLNKLKIKFEYEKESFPYTVTKSYKPDFKLSNGIYVETKGRFTGVERSKHLQVRKNNPHLDIRFIFRLNNKLTKAKGSQRYSDWCEEHGFKYIIWDFPKKPKPGWKNPHDELEKWLEEEK